MSSTPRFDYAAEPLPLQELGAIHVIAIGGAGMSAVARLALQAGCRVSGSDARDSAVLSALRAAGARVHVGHDPAHLEGADTVVISSAVREDNVELAAARAAGLRVLHRSQALAALAASTPAGRSIAIAGANGKTTTTSMLTVALQEAGADPSFAIGGELAAAGTNAALGAGEAFVIEADESDGSFLAYRPDVAIVTNVQPDHLDFYGTFEAVQEAYLAFAESIRPGGLLVACADDEGSARLVARVRASSQDQAVSVVTYGTDAGADVRILDPDSEGMAASAVLRTTTGSTRCACPCPGSTTCATRPRPSSPRPSDSGATPRRSCRASRPSPAPGAASSPRARRAACGSSTTTPTTRARSPRSSRRPAASRVPAGSSSSSSPTSTRAPATSRPPWPPVSSRPTSRSCSTSTRLGKTRCRA